MKYSSITTITALAAFGMSLAFANSMIQVTQNNPESKNALLTKIHELQQKNKAIIDAMEKSSAKIKSKINALENQREIFAENSDKNKFYPVSS